MKDKIIEYEGPSYTYYGKAIVPVNVEQLKEIIKFYVSSDFDLLSISEEDFEKEAVHLFSHINKSKGKKLNLNGVKENG